MRITLFLHNWAKHALKDDNIVSLYCHLGEKLSLAQTVPRRSEMQPERNEKQEDP